MNNSQRLKEMSTPQSGDAGEERSPPPQSPPVDDAEEKTNNDGAVIEDKATADRSDPPVEDKGTKENGEAAAPSSSGGENPAPAAKEAATPPPAKPSQPKQYVYDPKKITLKFIFANKDGVSVILDCKPTDTVGEVKGALLSMWPEGEINVFHRCCCVFSFSFLL